MDTSWPLREQLHFQPPNKVQAQAPATPLGAIEPGSQWKSQPIVVRENWSSQECDFFLLLLLFLLSRISAIVWRDRAALLGGTRLLMGGIGLAGESVGQRANVQRAQGRSPAARPPAEVV